MSCGKSIFLAVHAPLGLGLRGKYANKFDFPMLRTCEGQSLVVKAICMGISASVPRSTIGVVFVPQTLLQCLCPAEAASALRRTIVVRNSL